MKRRDFLTVLPAAVAVPVMASASSTRPVEPDLTSVVTSDGHKVDTLDCTIFGPDGASSKVVILMDGRAVAEAVMPHMAAQVKRYGLV